MYLSMKKQALMKREYLLNCSKLYVCYLRLDFLVRYGFLMFIFAGSLVMSFMQTIITVIKTKDAKIDRVRNMFAKE